MSNTLKFWLLTIISVALFYACPTNQKVRQTKEDLTQAIQEFEGTFSYLADANMFVSCDKSTRMPVEMEGKYLILERKYTNLVDGGTEVYVRLNGYSKEVATMESDRTEIALVVTKILEISKDKKCR